MAPSAVNNAGRADEGILARWHKDTNGSVASTGSANAYVYAANQTLSAYYDGLTITFDANFTNTAAATLDVDSVSADAIVWPDGGTLSGGEIVSGAKVTVRHDGTNWQLIGGGERLAVQTRQGTASGTEIDFTIGSGARRITIMFEGVSLSGTDFIVVQIGDSGGPESTGYVSTSTRLTDAAAIATVSSTSGFFVHTVLAANAVRGHMILTLTDPANNSWIQSHTVLANTTTSSVGAGSGTLDSALTTVRITRSGTNTFDGGAINILVE